MARGGGRGLHPVLREAAIGRLPLWSQVESKRRAHLDRVAELMGEWATELGHADDEVQRWRAAGRLHDLMKDGDPRELRILAGVDWPRELLHGPALASRLRGDGIRDDEFLLAVSHHSVGHPSFGELGRCLYIADFLDPGRRFRRERRAALRERMPGEREEVAVESASLRLGRLLQKRLPILEVSVRFWNHLLERRT